jgi:uncharacterized protein (TIGR02594 family)
MRLKMLFVAVCLSLGLSFGVSATAFAGPQMQTVNISKGQEVTDVSARRRTHHVKRHKVRQVRAVAPSGRFAAECYTIMPCEGLTPYQWSGGRNAAPMRVAQVRVSHRRAARVVRTRNAYASLGAPDISIPYSANRLVAIARSQLGNGAIYGRRNLWCARFMNYVVRRAGYRGTGSDLAADFAHWREGQRVYGPRVGAIAVMSRGRSGGHVGIVSGIAADGNPILISGNHGHAVREAEYSARRIYAYVVPR